MKMKQTKKSRTTQFKTSLALNQVNQIQTQISKQIKF
jgi:hypothetical protein